MKKNTYGKLFGLALAAALSDYVEPAPGARDRVENTLKIMLTAYQAARLRTKAEKMLEKLKEEQ